MGQLEDRIRQIAAKNGIVLIGFASRGRLLDAPPSANPDYLLPGAQTVISMALTLDQKAGRDFLAKRSWLPHGDDRQAMVRTLYTAADQIAALLRTEGHQALVAEINNNFRPEDGAADVTEMTEFYPEFAHRYGAVAAGIGRLGWSGNVMHPDYGAQLELGSVITTAKLEPSPLMEQNPCDRCKMCTLVCPVGMIPKRESTQVRIAGITEEIAQKQPVACCWIGCSGYHSLSRDGKWSNWSPYRLDAALPVEKAPLDALNISLQKADPIFQVPDSSFADYRGAAFNPDWHFGTVCGNCRLVCWRDRAEREANWKLLKDSGVAALAPSGDHVATAADDVVEIETPFLVRVAVRKDDYAAAQNGPIEIGPGYTPVDTEVLKHVFKKGQPI